MAMQLYTGASSSSSSSMVSLKKFDVFISFRGEDTRRKFASYLYNALNNKVLTFIDENEIEKGDEVSSTLMKSIKEAYASVVIFSKDYASSKWCLNELVQILECKEKQGQIVIPVFYEVDPSHVRNQVGSYGLAFEEHEKDLRNNKDKLQKWRNALTEAANLSGWHYQNDRNESNFIKDIVEDVLKKLNGKLPFEVNKEIVGFEEKYEDNKWILKTGSTDVRTLVLWGMGGIGKTTLAKYLYAKQYSQFDRHCLLDVREESAVHKLCLSKLFELPLNVESPILERKLACEKSLILLDGVATLEQAENINIVTKCLGPGSRVIVTTRDKQICTQFDECTIYEVTGLNKDDSRQLFCLHAFQKNHAKDGYEELIERAVGYCGGNPLALKVLGMNFRTKSKEFWESELEKLKTIPNRGIYDVLKLSFDNLDRTQQDIFLDIACFFNSGLRGLSYFGYTDLNHLTVLFDACNFFAVSAIEVLVCKALIEVIDDVRIKMHDLLVEMGREIVKQKSPENSGRRSRLWDSEDVYDVLKYNKGTDVVEGLYFDVFEMEDLYLSSDSFKSMINLRFLHITTWGSNVHFPKGLEWLSDKLRYLYWKSFPLESLPSTFCAKNLVLLSLQDSKLRKLWNGIQKLDNLMVINLDHSKDLIEIPDLSRAPNLETVSLNHCTSLCQLHPSVFTRPKLKELQLFGCKKIKSLKTIILSKNLQRLDLSGCSSLVEFSVTLEEMTRLSLHGTAIHELPSSIWHNSKLVDLDLGECKKLNIVRKKLSTDLGLRSLRDLNLSGCTEINASNLWFILDGTPSLKYLDLSECCNLETLPNNIQNNYLLEYLKLDECSKLKCLPKLPRSLRELTAFNCTYLDTNNILHRFNFNTDSYLRKFCYYGPGCQVPCEFVYHTTKASIDIPLIPKSGLCGFIFCVVLYEGLNFSSPVGCTIYEHGKKIFDLEGLFVIPKRRLVSDHVLLCSWNPYSKWVKMGNESGGDHYNLSFEFRYFINDRESSTQEIKGCGVFPLYGLEHSLRFDGRSSRGVEIVELQSSSEESDLNFDIDDSQNHRSTDEIEEMVTTDDKEEDLNDKSSCGCSIGLLLKHVLEECKRYFS